MPLKLIPELHRATHRVSTYIAAAPNLELTQAEAHLMAQLASGMKGLGELHETFGHKRSTLTSILDRLASRGLITREVPEEDRRSVIVRPTPAGKSVARKSSEYLTSLLVVGEELQSADRPARTRSGRTGDRHIQINDGVVDVKCLRISRRWCLVRRNIGNRNCWWSVVHDRHAH